MTETAAWKRDDQDSYMD